MFSIRDRRPRGSHVVSVSVSLGLGRGGRPLAVTKEMAPGRGGVATTPGLRNMRIHRTVCMSMAYNCHSPTATARVLLESRRGSGLQGNEPTPEQRHR